jgi:hypothetical protein
VNQKKLNNNLSFKNTDVNIRKDLRGKNKVSEYFEKITGKYPSNEELLEFHQSLVCLGRAIARQHQLKKVK